MCSPRDEGPVAESPPRTINHHGRTVEVPANHSEDKNDLTNKGGLMAFFDRKRVEDAWESATPPTAIIPMVKDVLKVQNMTVGDLTARNETVTINPPDTDRHRILRTRSLPGSCSTSQPRRTDRLSCS